MIGIVAIVVCKEIFCVFGLEGEPCILTRVNVVKLAADYQYIDDDISCTR